MGSEIIQNLITNTAWDSMPAAVSMCQAKLKKEKGSMVGGICISISYGCCLPLARKVREISVYAKSFT